jgi:Peptidase family M28
MWQTTMNDRYNPDMFLGNSFRCLVASWCALAYASLALGQLPTANPVPFSGAVPSGTGACSVAKSCAEVAPDIIRKALGPSTLEENLHHLANSPGAPATGSATSASEAAWGGAAFRRVGVADVHTEKFAVPATPGAKSSGESANVIAEIRGRELPDEFVIVVGHLGQSSKASDPPRDGETAAMVIDAARAIQASGSIPRRSIRFVLLAGANQGMLASQAYVAVHRAELDHIIAAVSMDGGIGRVTGFSLGGRKDMSAAMQEALAPVRSLGATRFTTDAKISLDSFDFLLEGIPTLIPNEEPGNSAVSRQATQGPYNAAAIDALKHQVAIVAVSAYALSDAEGRVGSRQSRSEVEQLLNDTGLAEQMKISGIWTGWEKGERGRQP